MQLLKKRKLFIILGVALVLLGCLVFLLLRKSEPFERFTTDLTLNEESFYIGDKIIVTLTVNAQSGYTVEMPVLFVPEEIDLVRKEVGTKKAGEYIQYVDYYYLITFEPGVYILPDLVVQFTTPEGELETVVVPGPTLTILSLLTPDSTDIRDLKPLVSLSTNEGLLVYLFIALLLALLFFVLRRKRKQTEVEPEMPIPAHILAYQRLTQLDLSDFIENGEIDRYFTTLSNIVREYIENRFAIKAQEMTTEEFMEKALRNISLTSDQQELLKDFLYQSDLVKYARHIPTYEQIRHAFVAAKRFVDETKPSEEVEVEGGVADVAQSVV